MHELSTMVRLVNQAEAVAKEHHATSVEKIIVEVGEMTDILPEYLQKYYPEATKRTLLEGSSLEINQGKARVLCLDCNTEYRPAKEFNYCCPRCQSRKGKILSGRSVILKQVILTSE